MRSPIVALAALALSCAAPQTTAAGRLGHADVALPQGIAKGTDDPTGSHERSAEVCQRERATGVRVVVRWQTFKKQDDLYIAGYDVELAKPVEGMTVTLVEPGPATNANPEGNGPHVAVATITVKCKVDGVEVLGRVPIRADGK